MANYLARYIPSNVMIPVLQSRPGVKIKKLGEGQYQVTRLITAGDERAVIREIRREEGSPLEIKLHVKTFLNSEIISRRYKMMFLQALAFNVEAGMSAGKALEIVIRNEANVAVQMELTAAQDILTKGGAFSDALDAISFFDRITISILVAGEKTGSLRQALASAVEHYESTNHTSKTIFGMFSFLIIDLLTVVSTSVGVQWTFIPMMQKQGIESKDPALVEAFQRKIELAYLMNGALLWVAVLITVVAGIFAYFAFSKRPSPMKTKVEHLVGRMPLLSSFFTNTAVAESFAVAATMLSGGVRLNETVDVAQGATSYPSVQRYWQRVRKRLMMGDTVSRAMLFTPITQTEYLIISAHRSASQLTKVFRDIANERARLAIINAKVINRALVIGSMAYAASSVLIYLWLLWVQNEQVMAGLGAK